MRKTIYIILILITTIFIASSIFIRYPQQWKSIKIGMPRQQMVMRLGESLSDGAYAFKGDIYEHKVFIGWYRMDILTDTTENIYYKSICLYFGTYDHYRKLNCIEND